MGTLHDVLYSLLAIINEMSPYVLLGFFIAGLLHAFISPDLMGRHFAGGGWRPVVKAALFGIPLPLCSCGVLPTAISLRRNGASRGATTSFLIATPQTGVDSIAATWSLLGLPFAVLRPVAALVGAFAGGMAVDKFAGKEQAMPEEVDVDLHEHSCGDGCCSSDKAAQKQGFMAKLGEALRYGFIDMVGSVGKWLVIGLIVAALITIFVPESFFTSLSAHPLLAMLAVVIVAVPMYICATGSIPIALSLMLKGLSPGVAFVLLMAGPAANFASILLLSRTQGARATAIYVSSVVVTAMAFGIIIDTFLPADWFVPNVAAASCHGACHTGPEVFATICSIVLGLLLLASAVINRIQFKNKQHKIENTIMETRVYQVKGMSCNHCKASVEKAVGTIPGVETVAVDLAAGTVTVCGDVVPEVVKTAIRDAGFEVE